jgi:hypothetical protein
MSGLRGHLNFCEATLVESLGLADEAGERREGAGLAAVRKK